MGFDATPKFPGAVAGAADLLNQKNFTKSETIPSLAASMLAGDTSFTLQTGTGASFPTTDFVVTIDSEIIFVGTVTGDVCSGLIRAYEGTTAASHASGTQVNAFITALSHNQVAAEVSAIETALGANLSNVQAAGAAAGGDLSGTYPNPTVAKVNGAVVPASKTIVGTDASGHIVDASAATLANNTTGTAAGLSGIPNVVVGTVSASTVNASTGFQIGGAAVSGTYLRGDGTNYSASVIQGTDLPPIAYASNGASSATITGYNVLNNQVTYDADNSFQVGQLVTVSSSALNVEMLPITAATPTTFTVNFVHANVTQIATGGTAYVANWDFRGGMLQGPSQTTGANPLFCASNAYGDPCLYHAQGFKGGQTQFIQTNQGFTASSVSSLAVPYNSNVTAGDFLLVAVWLANASSAPTISDTLGNAWTLQVNGTVDSSSAYKQYLWYCRSSVAGGANTVTISWTTPNSNTYVAVGEWYFTGFLGAGANLASNSSGSALTNPASVPLYTANQFAVGFAFQNPSGHSFTPNVAGYGPWTNRSGASNLAVCDYLGGYRGTLFFGGSFSGSGTANDAILFYVSNGANQNSYLVSACYSQGSSSYVVAAYPTGGGSAFFGTALNTNPTAVNVLIGGYGAGVTLFSSGGISIWDSIAGHNYHNFLTGSGGTQATFDMAEFTGAARSAPGANWGRLEWQAGTVGGMKLVGYAGTSTVGSVIADNVGNGRNQTEPCVAYVDATAQAAAIATTTLYAVPAAGAGQYRLHWNAKVTTPGTTSSTLGALTVTYVDPDGVTQTITCAAQSASGTIETSDSGNNTTTVLLGMPILLNANSGTNITYAFNYASVGATPMQYNINVRLESL